MKKCRKIKLNRNKIILGIIILISLSFLVPIGIDFIQKKNPVYKIEDRTEQIKKEQKKRKEKVVGWLRVQGTNIDHPIIYNSEDLKPDNLTYDFGWTNEEKEKLGNREFVIGHNILNVSKNPLIANPDHKRFEHLMSFVYYDFAKENQYIQYTIGGKNYLYKIFAVSFIKDSYVLYREKEFSKKKLSLYIEQAKEMSFYDYKVDVNKNDDIITLVTCTRFFGPDLKVDFKIDARKVRENENIIHYKVAELPKYDKIKEEMKGDVSDEKA